MTTNEAPRYRVNTLSWIVDTLVAEGKTITFHGEPGSNLDPLNAAAEAAVAKVGGHRPRPDVPLMPVPSAPPAAPVDWREEARKHGWSPEPPKMAEPEKQAQAPQPAPAHVPTAKAGVAGGSAASKLNPPAAPPASKPSADI